MYRLLLHRNIEKQLSKIPKPDARRLADKMRSLNRPHQAIHLGQELYQLRLGAYRIIYAIFDADQVMFVGKVVHHSEKTYRDLKTILNTDYRSLGKREYSKPFIIRDLVNRVTNRLLLYTPR